MKIEVIKGKPSYDVLYIEQRGHKHYMFLADIVSVNFYDTGIYDYHINNEEFSRSCVINLGSIAEQIDFLMPEDEALLIEKIFGIKKEGEESGVIG